MISSKHPLPHPLLDTLANISEPPACVLAHIQSLAISGIEAEYNFCREFLKSYAHSKDTYNSYRREVERLLQWAWIVAKKSLKQLTRNDIRDYLAFVNQPPVSWIGTKTTDRFIDKEGLRIPNPLWRPYVARLSKVAHHNGQLANKSSYQLSNKSIEAIFACLSSLFTFLQQEEYLEINPINLIRQKKGYIQRQQTTRVTRKLSRLQWNYVITTAETLAKQNPDYQRVLFLLSCFYLLGLRISELAYTNERRATMGNFAPDKHDLWWYTTIGKGNKLRDIAVPDELLQALKQYRTYLGLPGLPSRGEATPLIPKARGRGGLGTRQIRKIIQEIFNRAVLELEAQQKTDEAQDLANATVHWLRHTAISTDVEFRPREHIRDDVGHENPATMDKYIDTDRLARHQSAQGKTMRPKVDKDKGK